MIIKQKIIKHVANVDKNIKSCVFLIQFNELPRRWSQQATARVNTFENFKYKPSKNPQIRVNIHTEIIILISNLS